MRELVRAYRYHTHHRHHINTILVFITFLIIKNFRIHFVSSDFFVYRATSEISEVSSFPALEEMPTGVKRKPAAAQLMPAGVKRKPAAAAPLSPAAAQAPVGVKRKPAAAQLMPAGVKRKPAAAAPLSSAAVQAAVPGQSLPPVPTPADGGASGPPQRGRGYNGQYVYWITQAHPTAESVRKLGLKVPGDFSRQSFGELTVKVHAECGIAIVETACFLEPHENGLLHNNVLIRAANQFRWFAVAERFFNIYKVSVNYGSNILTWSEGVIYGRVASDHKPPERLDQHPTQWAANGHPARFEDCIPKKWQADGFVRKPRMSPMGFLDACRKNRISTEIEAWALGANLEAKGDKGFITYLMENDAAASIAKVCKAAVAQEQTRRASMSRLQILIEFGIKATCTCSKPGACYWLIKDMLQKNRLDGYFQNEVIATLVAGRLKKRNLCIIGGSNTAKSFALKPLTLIYRAYSRPDSGSYQLEDIVGSEIAFYNDFEYDEDAKKWLPWQYFKTYLEGGSVKVAKPKNRGGNVAWDSTAPVFMTAPQEVALWRGKTIDRGETKQMQNRIKYIYARHEFQEVDRVECLPCGLCGAQIYLEGHTTAGGQQVGVCPVLAPPPTAPAKKNLSATGMVTELTALQRLKDAGALSTSEFQDLKAKILKGL